MNTFDIIAIITMLVLLYMAFILFSFLPEKSYAQFKEKGPKNGNYSKWASKREFNGYKLNYGQRKSLGLSTGLFNTGIAQNWKVFNKKKKKNISKKPNEAIKPTN